MLRFDDRAVLVTGAGRGMGRAHALLLAARGARVVVSDLGTDVYGAGADPSAAESVAAEIRAAGGEAIACTLDIATEDGARGAVRATIDAFGRIDALVHNAGFTLGALECGAETLQRLDRLLAINTRAAVALAAEAWPHMQAQGHGRIVLVASTAFYGLAQSTPYSASKASFLGLARALAGEGAACGIKVNVLAPGGATRMAANLADTPFRTWFMQTMRPELTSPAVAVLAHDSCPITGETLVAAGGRVARMAMAENDGFTDPALTPESLLANMGRVMDPATLRPVRDCQESLALSMRLLGFAGEVSVRAGSATPN